MSNTYSFLASFSLIMITNGWNYKDQGPEVWHEYYSACGGEYQSPINIDTKPLLSCANNETLSLKWITSNKENDFIVKNNGYTMVLTPVNINSYNNILLPLTSNKNTIAKLPNIWYNSYNSIENKDYCLDSIHFHWSETSENGSEHTFNGKSSAFELHFLHYSCDYASLGDALSAYNNGRVSDEYVLSAIGILFDIGKPNKAIDAIVQPNIINETYKINGNDNDKPYKVSHIITKLNIYDLLPKNLQFVTYLGSITAPPCNETVRWNVLTNKLTISESQLNEFRKLLASNNENDKLINTHRPIQSNLNKLYYCQNEFNLLMLKTKKEGHLLAIIIIVGSVIFLFIFVIGICKYNKKRKENGYFTGMVSMSAGLGANNDQEIANDRYIYK